jgi:hypothetical protein
MGLLPSTGLPKMEHSTFLKIRDRLGLKGFYVLAWRGYFDSFGGPGNNRSLYDDAGFGGDDDPSSFQAFNMNTDPNGFRKGHGSGSAKGMGMLAEGVWDYKIGPHYGASRTIDPACRQAGPVKVFRDADDTVPDSKIIVVDGRKMYLDTLESSVNHHPGGAESTSSLACQTHPPDKQHWGRYIDHVQKLLKAHKQATFKYAVIAGGQPFKT